jgi:hypothetical protein
MNIFHKITNRWQNLLKRFVIFLHEFREYIGKSLAIKAGRWRGEYFYILQNYSKGTYGYQVGQLYKAWADFLTALYKKI